MSKPTRAEDEYFAKKELERRKTLAIKRAEAMADGEKQRLKELHYMKCPKCGMDLSTIQMHGVNVDHCSACGGVWLDNGEVEQMLNHEAAHGVLSKIASAFK